MFAPLLPRFYSISSSQAVVGDEVHVTVARVRYELEGRKRLGICSHFLCDMMSEDDTIPIYLQPTEHFLLPKDSATPIIMVGPGTGVAPFLAFMQQRVSQGSHGNNWLFFGERHKEYDFFYESYWQELAQKGVLRLDCAFSRDTNEKVYVQHKLWAQRESIWKWLQEGAVFYVCGDISCMAKDVDKCLREIVQEQLKTDEATKAYIKMLRLEKRYLRDVY